ncbi:antirestriction protein ArdA [Nocardia wallacei]|uniref:antirestriction protein ArdA n=1 Tax=Nocardia wallacei TaxID=480035 RepID=UPI00245492F1|nr:antirestriction protein ArdA [Nocardia wallacei]
MNERFPNVQGHNETGIEAQPPAAETDQAHERTPQLNPRIYVTAGLPLRAELTRGSWFDMARDANAVRADLYAVFGDHNALEPEGLYIWNYDDFADFQVTTGAIDLEEVQSIELLAQVARGIAEHGPAFAAWASAHEDDPRLFDHFATAYEGHYDSLASYVREQFRPADYDEILDRTLPAEIRPYASIDYEAIGEEWQRDMDMVVFPATGGGVWIFDERA